MVRLTLIAWLLLCAPSWAQWPYTCVADLTNGHSGGSATLVAYSEDGKRARLLSCQHVFDEGVDSPYVRFSGGTKKYYCRVLGMDARADLSCLECYAPQTEPKIDTPTCVRAACRDDKAVVAVGYPWYGQGKCHYSKGKYLGYSGNDCHFTAPVHSGYSGGALFSEDGAFIGVVCGFGTNYSYAPSGPALINFAAKYVEVKQ
jgi:hypothetical protein